jgi:hypothetical protein
MPPPHHRMGPSMHQSGGMHGNMHGGMHGNMPGHGAAPKGDNGP